MADETICEENNLCLNDSGVSVNNVQRKKCKGVLCEKRIKCAWVLAIVLILLNITFVIVEKNISQEHNNILNKTDESPKSEGLVSDDSRCLATVQRIHSTQHTEEECVAHPPTGERLKYKQNLNWTECGKDVFLKTGCICEGFNLSRFQKCERDFDVDILGCNKFTNMCKDFLKDATRILSCHPEGSVNRIKCGEGYAGHFCENKIKDEFFTCEMSFNKLDGISPCNAAGQNQECFIYQDGSKLLCTQGKSIKRLLLCNGTKLNSPLHSSMKSNDKPDSPKTYSSINDDLSKQIVLIVLECILVVVNVMPLKYLKCCGQNKAKRQLILTAISVFLLIFNAVVSALLASRAPSSYGKYIVIVAFIFIFLAFLLIFGDFYSVIRKMPNPCSRNENKNQEVAQQLAI